MKLSPSAWINCGGTGDLFSPPFLSRCLLFRLYDVNYSLLVYHEQTSSCSYDGEKNGVFSFTGSQGKPEAIHVHLAPSTRPYAGHLIKRPSTRLDLPEFSAVQRSFGEIALKVEPFGLPGPEMHIVGRNCAGGVERQIANTAYCIRSSGPPVNLGKGLQGAPGVFKCWKISVMRHSSQECYGLDSVRDWSVKALEDDAEWPPRIEMRLAKR
jgi:hypothetical protein